MASAVKKAVTISVLAMFVMVLTGVTVAAESASEDPVGLDISATFSELIAEHRATIRNFILDHKLRNAEHHERRLEIVDEMHSQLRATIDEVNAERQALVDKLREGEITNKEFAAEMQRLANRLSAASRTIGTLGEHLKAIGQEIGEEHRARAQELANANRDFGSEMAEAGNAIGEEMRQRGLRKLENLPEKPEVPGKPETPGTPETPGKPETPGGRP